MATTDRGGSRWPGRAGKVAFGVAGFVGLGALAVFALTERRLHARFDVKGEPLVVPSDAESLKEGERLAASRGCLECHGEQAQGKLAIDAMPVMRLRPSNLTTGGPTAKYTGEDWSRSVRHCVRPDGSGIPFMPCEDYRFLDARDLGRIVAYLRSLPPSTNDPGKTELGPVGRALYLKGDLPYLQAERLDHAAPVPDAPPVGATAEYGKYLAAGCTGCHGAGFSGGPIPGAPPEWPPAANLTPHASGLGDATEWQFVTALTTGQKRAGGELDPTIMPWRQLARLTPTELRAMWVYLQTLPAKPAGGR